MGYRGIPMSRHKGENGNDAWQESLQIGYHGDGKSGQP